MSDDYINLWIVMFVIILFIMYLNYMQNMAIIKNDWNDLKCNPLFMLTNSLSQTAAESSAAFQTCVNKYSSYSKTNRQIKNKLKK